MTDQELYSWVLTVKPDDLPNFSWYLYPWAKVTDNTLFLWSIHEQAKQGEKNVRSKKGALQEDIRHLMFCLGKEEYDSEVTKEI